MGLEEVEEPILDGKVATKLLAFITRDRMVAEDVNCVTTEGQGLPARVSSRMGMPKNQRRRRRNWFGGQAFPNAGEGGTVSHPVTLAPSRKERRTESRLETEATNARLRRE